MVGEVWLPRRLRGTGAAGQGSRDSPKSRRPDGSLGATDQAPGEPARSPRSRHAVTWTLRCRFVRQCRAFLAQKVTARIARLGLVPCDLLERQEIDLRDWRPPLRVADALRRDHSARSQVSPTSVLPNSSCVFSSTSTKPARS